MSKTLAEAFPSGICASLSDALDALPRPTHEPLGSITSSYSREWPAIVVSGEPVEIPYRIYNPVPPERLAEEGSLIAVAVDCLYTRHHDGFVRQQALRRILQSEQVWTIPFIVQLLGEYVIEICADIHRFVELELPLRPALVQGLCSFMADNENFVALTEQRATSYWACYYRRSHPCRNTYPALVALNRMRELAD